MTAERLVAGDPVRKKAPRRRVALRRKEIAPVLADEPCSEESDGLGGACHLPELGDASREQHPEHAEPEGELVNANATEIDARTEAVAFEAQHEATVAAKG